MKQGVRRIWPYLPWLLLLLGVDGFAALLLWIADAQAFYAMAALIVLATVLFFSGVCVLLMRREQKREQALINFLDSPDDYHEELLIGAVAAPHREYIKRLGRLFRAQQSAHAGLQSQLSDYEEYVEAWAHEIKTPLSLLTFLLDNRREELPAAVSVKLDYIRNRLQECVDQMLFYARLGGTRKDYLLENLSVRTCVEEVLLEYQPLLEEKGFQISSRLSDDLVFSDRRGLRFLLGQIIGNSVKYCGGEPELCFRTFEKDGRFVLSIGDNGIGVRRCDLPYIFEKGFTGGLGEERKRATGMGLYLAKEMAKELNLTLYAQSDWGSGFEMQISFPVVQKTPDHCDS